MAVRRRRGKQQVRGQQGRDEIVWDFLSFPTFVGFAGGVLTTVLVIVFLPYFFVLLGALFLATFAATHILFTGTRQRNEQRKRSREEEDELERRILARREADDTAGVTSRRARRRRGRA
jgi:hypothetical protein